MREHQYTARGNPFAWGTTSFSSLFRALRPVQWTKNALVLGAIIYAGQAFELGPIMRSLAAVAIFCAASSGIYLVNDIRDRVHDRRHPTKRFRPVASGALAPNVAWVAAVVLVGMAGIGAWMLRPQFLLVVFGYMALMVTYSWGLKRLVIVDVFTIAAGFVLRAAGGAIAITVPISPWLYVCTALGALLIGFGKRRHELLVLQSSAGSHRANLDEYTIPLLDQIIAIVSAATLVSYALYTFNAPNMPHDSAMMLTIPFVGYGLFRYLLLVHVKKEGGSPEMLLFQDRPLLVCAVGWAATTIALISLM